MNVIAQAVAMCLDRQAAWDKAVADKVKEAQEKGLRIVTIDDCCDTGKTPVIDYFTNEVLLPSMSMDWDESWRSYDGIIEEVYEEEKKADWPNPLPAGLPGVLREDIIQSIDDWIHRNRDEAKAWLATQVA